MEETYETITRDKIAEALRERILHKFTTCFNEKLRKLYENPLMLSVGLNQVFVSEVKLQTLSNSLRKDMMDILVNIFGFKRNEILNVELSSDDMPCILVHFKLNEI